MKKTMYLQKNYNGSYALAVANPYKNDEVLGGADYILVMDNINKNTSFETINKMVVEKFGCEKLVIQF